MNLSFLGKQSSINTQMSLFKFKGTSISLFWQDSKAQVTAIHLITGTLQRMNIFGVENRDTLTHKATGVGSYFSLHE